MNQLPKPEKNIRRRFLPYTVAAIGALTLLGSKSGSSEAAEQAPPTKLIGVVEDLRNSSIDYLKTRLDLIGKLGVNAIGYDTTWQEGQAEAINDVKALEAPVNEALALGIEPIIRFYPCADRNTTDVMKCHYPQKPSGEKMFATTLANLAKGLPEVRKWVIGNEPNSWRFLSPQYDENGGSLAPAYYTRLLARSYDVLKEISPANQVICGALASVGYDNPGAKHQSHSVAKFIEGMGDEYRRLDRKAPLCDVIDLHPYGRTPNESPMVAHTDKTIAFADLGKLETAWAKAFAGTAQSSKLPIYLSEYGIDTEVPPDKKFLYSGSSGPRVSEPVQAEYYNVAIQFARSDPRVGALLIFHAFDEQNLNGWQSGIYYPDQTKKSSFDKVAQAISAG